MFLFFFILRPYIRSSRRIRHINSARAAMLQNLFIDAAGGLVYFRAFGWEEYHLERGFVVLDESQTSFFYTMGVEDWLESVSSFFSGSLVVAIAALSLGSGNTQSLALIGLSLFHASTLHKSIYNLSQALRLSDETWGTLSELLKFFRDTPREPHFSVSELPEGWPNEGSVVLRNVSARYGYVPNPAFT